jgi:hypothetical protein
MQDSAAAHTANYSVKVLNEALEERECSVIDCGLQGLQTYIPMISIYG